MKKSLLITAVVAFAVGMCGQKQLSIFDRVHAQLGIFREVAVSTPEDKGGIFLISPANTLSAIQLKSPNGKNTLTLSVSDKGVFLRVTQNNQEIIEHNFLKDGD